MKNQHFELAEAAEKVAQLQKDLDPIHDVFFGDDKPDGNVIAAVSKDAFVKYLQSGVFRAQAQKVVSTLIYRVRYLSLPGNPWRDSEEEKQTRRQNRQARKDLGMSVAQYRKRSQAMIDILLPVAIDFVQDAQKCFEEYKTLSAEAKPAHQCASGGQEKQRCGSRPRMPRVITEEEKRMQERTGGLRLGHATPDLIAALAQQVVGAILANDYEQVKQVFVENTTDAFIKPRAIAKVANETLAGISSQKEDRRIVLEDNNSPPSDEEIAQGFQFIDQTVMVKRMSDDATKVIIAATFTYQRKVLVAQAQ